MASAKKKEREFLDLAMKRLKKCVQAEDHNRTQAVEDLKFLNGDQWKPEEKQRRSRRKRPVLTINMLPDKVDRVVGDMRQNRTRVKIRGADSKAQTGIAKVREGIVADIEYRSNASTIYDYAGGRAVECGFGAWRILTRYCEDNPFVQEIYLELIKNSFAVYLDPAAKDPCKSDGKYGFILSKMPVDDFKDTYPKSRVPGDSLQFGQGLAYEHWYDGETVTVAEYFTIEPEKTTFCLMEDGIVLEQSEAQEKVDGWNRQHGAQANASLQPSKPPVGLSPLVSPALQPQPGVPSPQTGAPGPAGPPQPAGINPVAPGASAVAPAPTAEAPPSSGMVQGGPGMVQGGPGMVQGGPGMVLGLPQGPPISPEPKILRTKEVEVNKVKHHVITAFEIIEGPNDFPGKYVPIVIVTGKERNVEGKDYIRGLIRDAKDPQRLVNYWNTAAAELIALAPKAPWIGTAKQFEGYEEDYANANTENFPFLKFNPDPLFQTAPQRNHAGDPPVAIFTQIQISENNLKTVVGVGPDFQDMAAQASAKSLIQRQKPMELGTFPFVDNLSRSIAYSGRIINEMIPEVYDTERDVRIRNLDGSESFVPINTTAEQAIKLLETDPDRYHGFDVSKLRHVILSNGGDARFNEIGTGKYEVIVDIGPSYTTQRQEAADNFVMLAQTYPAIWQVAGDLIVKSLDVNGADEMAERLKRLLPPGLIRPKPGEPVQPPMPPSPQLLLVMAKAQTEMIKQKKEDLKTKVEMIRMYKEAKETDTEIRKEILKVLAELHAPQHPGDELTKLQMSAMKMGQGNSGNPDTGQNTPNIDQLGL